MGHSSRRSRMGESCPGVAFGIWPGGMTEAAIAIKGLKFTLAARVWIDDDFAVAAREQRAASGIVVVAGVPVVAMWMRVWGYVIEVEERNGEIREREQHSVPPCAGAEWNARTH